MTSPGARLGVALGFVIVALAIAAAPAAFAQAPPQQEEVNQMATQLHYLTDVQRQENVDPRQAKAYKRFFDASWDQPDKKIQLGNEFLTKYPKSPFIEPVDAGLTNAYFMKQDWQNFFAYADKTLALNPDEVDVLTVVGWVIPHQYDPNSPSAAQSLTTAEADEKHALDLLAKMTKPKDLSDAQFTAMKSQKEQQAHSALGLIYFRRGDYANSASELQQLAQGADQTDVFVLGVDLQNLNRHADAAAAFTRCGQIAGALQDRCKQSADEESKLAHGGM